MLVILESFDKALHFFFLLLIENCFEIDLSSIV